MPCKKYMFDWSVVTRFEILTHLGNLVDVIVDKPLTPHDIYHLISKTIKQRYPVLCKRYTKIKSAAGTVSIGGCYYPSEDQVGNRSILLKFYFNNAEQHLTLSFDKFISLCRLISDTILHEIIHMYQYRRRKFKVLAKYKRYSTKALNGPWQRYLGEIDEIDAHAFNIACELLDNHRSIKKISKLLKSNSNIVQESASSYSRYIDKFNSDYQHPTMVMLEQKIIEYLPMAKCGRPFNEVDELKLQVKS